MLNMLLCCGRRYLTMSGAKAKTVEPNVPTERRRAVTPEDLPMRYEEWKYIKKNTDFSDKVIFHWCNMVKEKSIGVEICIMMEHTAPVINIAYGDSDQRIFNKMWKFSDGGLFYLKFKHFMTAIRKLSDADNLEDLRLDLTALMCCDIHGKDAKVNPRKLGAVLKEAGQIENRHFERLQNDIDDIFHTLKDHVSVDGKMDVAYFRYGIQISDKGITDKTIRDSKYHVSTCVPEMGTAILAIANYAVYPGSLKLSSKKLSVLPNAIIKREDSPAAAESGQAAAASGSK